MKTVTLSIGERFKAINLLNEGKFDNSTLAVVLDDIKKIAITEEEWAAAHLVKSPTDEEVASMPDDKRATAQQAWKWDENESTEKTMDLDQLTVDALSATIKAKSDAKSLSIGDGAVITLGAKLSA